MKAVYTITLLTLFSLFSGCEKDKITSTTGIVGEWKLAEELISGAIIFGEPPADFEPVQSDKTISFTATGMFFSNGEMCTMSNQASNPSDGMFYEALLTIEPEGCQFASPTSGITYQLDGDTLIIIYPCYESCVQKYYRI